MFWPCLLGVDKVFNKGNHAMFGNFLLIIEKSNLLVVLFTVRWHMTLNPTGSRSQLVKMHILSYNKPIREGLIWEYVMQHFQSLITIG